MDAPLRVAHPLCTVNVELRRRVKNRQIESFGEEAMGTYLEEVGPQCLRFDASLGAGSKRCVPTAPPFYSPSKNSVCTCSVFMSTELWWNSLIITFAALCTASMFVSLR